MAMRVVAVVVTHNRLEMLKECLKSLFDQSCPCDIMVIDNASDDGTGEFLTNHYAQKLDYYNTGTNLGGAGGFHIGMRRAVEAGYSHVWVMDDDCFPEANALEKLMEADALLGGAGQYGFLSSAVLWTDRRECVMNRQHVSRDYYRQIHLLRYGLLRVYQATFVSLLVPAETIRRFGLPYKEYFIWGDDVEFTRRIALRGGIPCYMAGQSQVVHAMKNNVGSDISVDEISRLPRYTLSVRNECKTFRQEGLYGWCFYAFHCIRAFYRICSKAKDHRMLRMKALFAGMLKGPFFWPKLEFPQSEICKDAPCGNPEKRRAEE